METRTPHQRSTTIVDRRFQFQFAAQMFLLQLVVILSFQSLMQLRLKSLAETAPDAASQALLMEVGEASLQTMLIVGTVTGTLLFLLGLWFSNKLVGPLPRLRAGLQALSRGDFNARLHFRPGDVLEDVAGEFNLCAEALGERYGRYEPLPSLTSLEASRETPTLTPEESLVP